MRWPIERIDVQEVELLDINYVADYAGKALKTNRVSPDDVIILPERRTGRTIPAMSQEERAVKELQARHNLSEEALTGVLKSRTKRMADA